MKNEKKFAVNWKDLGLFLAHLNFLFTVIRGVWGPMGIGLEVIEWLLKDGRSAFIEEFLKPLGEKAIAHRRVLVVNATTIRVNLNLPITLRGSWMRPSNYNKRGGWVEVQRRKDDLYINGRKLCLYQSESQKQGGNVWGDDLFQDLKDKEILHPNIIDGLLEYPLLIPDALKFAEDGQPLYLFFMGATHHDGAYHMVRCLCWREGESATHSADKQWGEGASSLMAQWGPNDRVVLLEDAPITA